METRENFSLLTKYLSNYLSTPTAQGPTQAAGLLRQLQAKLIPWQPWWASCLLWSWVAISNKWCLGPKPLPSHSFCTPGCRGPWGKQLVNRSKSQPYSYIWSYLISPITLPGGFIITPPYTLESHFIVEKIEAKEVTKAEWGLEIKSANSESVLLSFCHGDRTLSILRYSEGSALTSNSSNLSSQVKIYWGWRSGWHCPRKRKKGKWVGSKQLVSHSDLSENRSARACLGNPRGTSARRIFAWWPSCILSEPIHSMGTGVQVEATGPVSRYIEGEKLSFWCGICLHLWVHQADHRSMILQSW